MKSIKKLSRLVIFFSMILGFGLAVASDEPPMKMPENGTCEGSYILFEDVCILPATLQGDPAAVMERINQFKNASENPRQAPEEEFDTSDDNPVCASYKKMLHNYMNEGVMAYNPDTGKMEKTRDPATEAAIEEAKEYIMNFCNE